MDYNDESDLMAYRWRVILERLKPCIQEFVYTRYTDEAYEVIHEPEYEEIENPELDEFLRGYAK